MDERPKSVDFVPGTPEENLRHYRTQRERFASLYPVALHLPFRGAWTCTQGVDGEYTHQGRWRFAFDFEVQGDDGRLFARDGLTPEDHHCHRLPVLAAADGTVVAVERDVPDNALGGLDLEHNWGNLVMLHHAPGLYSLVAHLAPGTVRVQVGQVVRRGEVVGLCGNSGRSPRPHLHFQLQGSAVLGAPTLPCRFAEVVRGEAGGDRLWRELEPARGDVVRAVEPEDEVARCLPCTVGAVVVAQGHGPEETLTVEVDLAGRHVWTSSRGGLLYFARTPQGFVAQEALGPAGSVVHLLRVALARVPFQTAASLRWHDLAPSRWHGGPLRRLLRDFVAPFLSREGLEVEYRLTREAGRLVVTGRARLEQRPGAPVFRSKATLSPHGGLLSVEVQGPGRAARVATFTPHPVSPPRGAPLSLQPVRGDT